MKKKQRISRDDRDVLAQLVNKYSATALITAVRKMPSMNKKVGRPTNNLGNLVGVYGYVEFHRKERTSAGRPLGVTAACKRLKRTLDVHTVNCRTTVGRLRSMFYEAQSKAKSNFDFAALMRRSLLEFESGSANNVMFPLLMIRTKDGLQGPIIDTWGRGGREDEYRRSKSLH